MHQSLFLIMEVLFKIIKASINLITSKLIKKLDGLYVIKKETMIKIKILSLLTIFITINTTKIEVKKTNQNYYFS